MAKRDFRRDDLFDQSENASSGTSWQEIDSQIFGDGSVLEGLAAADAQRERLKRVDIFNVMPDLRQPRRAMPSSVRANWNGAADGISEMFNQWLEAVEQERGSAFDLDAYLTNESTERSEEEGVLYTPGPVELSLLHVVKLAASIRRDGLTNPVTVAPARKTGHFVLETGERRWLAYHLLWLWFNGNDGRPDERENWTHIPAREVKAVSVWRQANENNARADLNAVAKARQYAVLMMELLPDDFGTLADFDSDRAYYAQVKDARVPSGKGEELLAAMGVTNRSALSRYRRLLNLPDEIWQAGDDLNMAEERLYNLASIARTSTEKALERFQKIVAGRNISSREEEYGPGTKRHFSQLARAIKKAGAGRPRYNKEALKTLHELREWLDFQEERIRKFLD